MSFLYPRLVSIWRPNVTTAVGDQGYSGSSALADATEIFTDLPANIQLDRQGQRNPVGLPADAAYKPIWKVFMPLSAAPLGSFQSTDIVVDDTNIAFQIFAPYWNSLGYQLRGIVLEV